MKQCRLTLNCFKSSHPHFEFVMEPPTERPFYPRFDMDESLPPPQHVIPYETRFDGRYPAPHDERIFIPTEPVPRRLPEPLPYQPVSRAMPHQTIPPEPVKLFSGRDVVALIFAVLIPPVGVFMMRGFYADFWINLVLTILGYIPGQIHGVWVVLRYRLGKRGYAGEFPAHRRPPVMMEGPRYLAGYGGGV